MRILQVLPHLSKGGAERVVVELSNSLIDVGHEVTLLLAFPVDPDLNQKFLNKKVSVQFLSENSENRILIYLKLPFYVLKSWKDLKSYDVIHCHLTFGLLFGSLISLSRKVAKSINPRLIATCHVVGVGTSRTPRIINQRLSNFFDAFALMALDTQWRSFISNNRGANIHVIVNGITPKELRTKLKVSSKNPYWTVGTISRLQAERTPWLFLEVFAQLHESMNGRVRFVLGGEGPERTKLNALSKKLQLEEFLSMPGLIHNPETFLGQIDLYVALNVEEVTGIAGLEAVLSGIPTVSIQLSPTYKNGANDWIWSDQNPRTVAEQIANLLEDPKKLAELAKNQHRVAIQDYSMERMRDHYLNLYSLEERTA